MTRPKGLPLRYLLAFSYMFLFGLIGLVSSVLLYLGLTQFLWMFGLFRMEDKLHTVLQDIPQSAPEHGPPHGQVMRQLGGPIVLPENFRGVEQIPVNQFSSPFGSAAILDPSGAIVTQSRYFSIDASTVDPAKLDALRDKTSKFLRGEIAYEDHANPLQFRILWADGQDGEVDVAPVCRGQNLLGFIQMRNSRGPEHGMVQHFLTAVALGVALAMICIVLLSIALARLWSRPLEKLAEAAQRVAGGDLSTRTNIHPLASELQEVAVTFDSMVERLDTQFTMQRRFVADASHELKTPLAALEGQLHIVGLLEERAPDARRSQAIEAMSRDLSRMERLVADLLTLSKAEQIQAKQVPFSLQELQQEAVSAALSAFPGREIECTVNIAPNLHLLGEGEALEGALRNLLDNALQHTPDTGRVSLRIQVEGNQLKWIVKDSGCGIAPEHLPRLGQRFYRVDMGRARTHGGTGLGLSIVKAIAEKHGGTLIIESKAGQGTEATISLPVGLMLLDS